MKIRLVGILGMLFLFYFVIVQTSVALTFGSVKWKFDTKGAIRSSPAIGFDGTIYISSTNGYIYAINPNGTLKWKFNSNGAIYSSPSLWKNQVIYFGNYSGCLYALNLDGTLKWKLDTGEPGSSSILSSPSFDKNGTVYFGDSNDYLYAVSPNGKLKWKFKTDSSIFSSPIIGMDGTIYIGNYGGIFYALNPDGTMEWKFQTKDANILLPPAIGPDGIIYISDDNGDIYALNQNGKLLWKLHKNGTFSSSPAVAKDGTIYTGIGNYFYAINPNGTVKWKYSLLFPDMNSISISSPCIGSNGIIYFGDSYANIRAINSNGSVKWISKEGFIIESSPAIFHNTLYIGSYSGYLYAINISAQSLMKSCWPKFKHDNFNTGTIDTEK